MSGDDIKILAFLSIIGAIVLAIVGFAIYMAVDFYRSNAIVRPLKVLAKNVGTSSSRMQKHFNVMLEWPDGTRAPQTLSAVDFMHVQPGGTYNFRLRIGGISKMILEVSVNRGLVKVNA